MQNYCKTVVVTGMGVVTPIGIGVPEFTSSLKNGKSNFSVLEAKLAGRTLRFPTGRNDAIEFEKKIDALNIDTYLKKKVARMRHLSASTAYALFCVLEACADADWQDVIPYTSKVAIVSSGSNIQQAMLFDYYEQYRERLEFLNPNYAVNYFDTDIIGVISEILNIHGEGFSIGAASASGNMAIIQGCRLIKAGECDIVIVVAPLMDISVFEYQAFTSLGAMACLRENDVPAETCRPFDRDRKGFVYGQNSGCLILEAEAHAAKRNKNAYALMEGYGISLDANRGPNPSIEGEKHAMMKAIEQAGISARQIDYVNLHGTASVVGDSIELQAVLSSGLHGAKANSTKSLIGHGLSAAGLVEAIACIVQMREGFLHPNQNLTNAIPGDIGWIKEKSEKVDIAYSLNNSFGFGGINSSIVIKNQ